MQRIYVRILSNSLIFKLTNHPVVCGFGASQETQ